jgi:hypothetical protein
LAPFWPNPPIGAGGWEAKIRKNVRNKGLMPFLLDQITFPAAWKLILLPPQDRPLSATPSCFGATYPWMISRSDDPDFAPVIDVIR